MLHAALLSWHIFSIIAWLAGLLYLPRLFVYHAGVAPKSPEAKIFTIMEARLAKFIMVPAMLSAWLSGVFLAFTQHYWSSPWFLLKLCLVILLTIFHMRLAIYRNSLAKGENKQSARFFRIINEIPTILLLLIILLVFFRPFS